MSTRQSESAAGNLTRRDAVGACMAAAAGVVGISGTANVSVHSFFDQGQEPGILIRGGQVVNADGSRRADVRIRGETIAEVGDGLAPAAGERIIEAAAKLVMPGGIDPHTHLQPNFVDDLTTGTAAAIAGGITTVGTFAFAGRDETALQAVDRMERLVTANAIGDVMLHAHVWPPTQAYIDSLEVLARRGQPSIKIFMLRRDFDENADAVRRLLGQAARHGVTVLLHCEDAQLLAEAVQRLEAQNHTSLGYFAESRPVEAEVVATRRAVELCEATGAPIHIVHLSSKGALDACRNDRTVSLPLTIETRPLYLYFTADRFAEPDGPLYVGQPPLRSRDDVEALWEGLADGRIDMLATDHAPWRREQKLDPELSITRLRPGVSDLRFMLPVYFSEGVRKGRITPERFVATTSTNAARTFGLYPRKGVIQVGSEADVTIVDPERTATVRAADDPSNADYTVFEGWEVTGWPVTVIRRGEVAYEGSRVVAEAGSGRLAVREPRT